MNATNKWLDAAKERAGIGSDYQLAKRLGITSARIGNYRGARRVAMDDDLAVQVAELAGAPPAQVLGELHADKSTNPQTRAAWMKVAAMATRHAASLALAVAIIGGSAVDTMAPPARPQHFDFNGVFADLNGATVYIMSCCDAPNAPPLDPLAPMAGAAFFALARLRRSSQPKGTRQRPGTLAAVRLSPHYLTGKSC